MCFLCFVNIFDTWIKGNINMTFMTNPHTCMYATISHYPWQSEEKNYWLVKLFINVLFVIDSASFYGYNKRDIKQKSHLRPLFWMSQPETLSLTAADLTQLLANTHRLLANMAATWQRQRDEDGEGLKKKRGLLQAVGPSADTKADSFAMLEEDSALVPARPRPGKT